MRAHTFIGWWDDPPGNPVFDQEPQESKTNKKPSYLYMCKEGLGIEILFTTTKMKRTGNCTPNLNIRAVRKS